MPPGVEREVWEEVAGVFQNLGGTTGTVTSRRGTCGGEKSQVSVSAKSTSPSPLCDSPEPARHAPTFQRAVGALSF